MRGFQAEGAAPLVNGEPVPDPETMATAIRIGNPASWKLAEAARDESGGRFDAVSDDQILAAQRELAATTASSSSRPRRPASPVCCRSVAAGESYAGSTVVITVTGHGLKDTATALEGFGQLVDTVVDADVDRRGRGRRAGLRPVVTFVDGPVRVSVPATWPTSAPASTPSASPWTCVTSSRPR